MTVLRISEDSTTFTFNLHPDAMFNDGTPLTSEDVRFTLETAIIPETASFWKGRLMGLEGALAFADGEADTVAGIETPDEHTVILRLTIPDTAFLPTFADFTGLGILPKHVLGDVAPDQLINERFNLEPTVGAGPYQFVTYETDQFLELEPNPNWFGEAPAVDRLFLRVVQPETAVAELENGTLDLVAISLDDIEGQEGLTVVSVPSPSLDSISVNLSIVNTSRTSVSARRCIMRLIERRSPNSSIRARRSCETVRSSAPNGWACRRA